MNKAQLQLIGGIITAGSTLAGALLPLILPVQLSTPIVAFIGSVAMEVVIYFGTENPPTVQTSTTQSKSS